MTEEKTYKLLRGMRDILPDEAYRLDEVGRVAQEVAGRFGYYLVESPMLEESELFARSLGESTDVVGKEMYSFEDRKGVLVSLRPEMTAGIARMSLENGWHQSLPVRVFYRGAMFRYERPQKGRYRQFHQIGIESMGKGGARADAEVIAVAHQILVELGLEQSVKLQVNSLGSRESRAIYRQVLYDWLYPMRNELSEDSQKRLEVNPLRILDSKDEGDVKILREVPLIDSSWCDESKRHYDSLCEGLRVMDISYEENRKLVRGLDYYCHTIFEFMVEDWGSQGAVLAGGRYDGLTSLLGGESIPGVGWAGGIERIANLKAERLGEVERGEEFCLLPLGEEAEKAVQVWVKSGRENGWRGVVLWGYSKLNKGLKVADRMGVKQVIIVGENELQDQQILIRDMKSGDQKSCSWSEFPDQQGIGFKDK